MAARNQNDFSQGSLVGNILRLAGPMTLALLVNTLYSIVDRIYIGHIPDGKLALTGIGLAIQPFHPLLSPSHPTFNLAQHQGLFK